jgi:hypothetical protein
MIAIITAKVPKLRVVAIFVSPMIPAGIDASSSEFKLWLVCYGIGSLEL